VLVYPAQPEGYATTKITMRLYDKFREWENEGFIATDIPLYINQNLNPNFFIRPYQETTFRYFLHYLHKYKQRPRPSQLLFQMATGSGKTLVMAGCLLHLYAEGYRNFVFFVNSDTILRKTKDNFCNAQSSKYLFANKIVIDNQEVTVREVQNFEDSDATAINILFTTIQGLHSRFTNVRENSLSIEDFESQKIVLISDEAHHINADTKKGSKNSLFDEAKTTTKDETLSWETVVKTIFELHTDNLLLEFTATVDWKNKNIEAKYADKILMEYKLKDFKQDGYAKAIWSIETDIDNLMDRVLCALVISQTKLKIFEDIGLSVKPVLLMKSRNIKESEANFEAVINFIRNLRPHHLADLAKKISSTSLHRCFEYLQTKNYELDYFADEIRHAFSRETALSVNSKNDSDAKQLVLNSLEDSNNPYRMIFAVDMLNEGWDVLNLFDIVRLYDTKIEKEGKVNSTTVAEVQLIGRGARYFPFLHPHDDNQAPETKYKRKFDSETNHIIRFCETLHYHCSANPAYLRELDQALEQVGLSRGGDNQTIQREQKIKESFKNTTFYQEGYVYANKLVEVSKSGIFDENPDNTVKFPTDIYEYTLSTGWSGEKAFFDNDLRMNSLLDQRNYVIGKDIAANIVLKAMYQQRNGFFYFANLKHLFPHLKTVGDFVDLLAQREVTVKVKGTSERLQLFSPQDALEVVNKVLAQIADYLLYYFGRYQGTKKFEAKPIKTTFTDKTLNFSVYHSPNEELGKSIRHRDSRYYIDLSKVDWYVYDDNFGTSEEKAFIKFFEEKYGELRQQYDEIYLVRNERAVRLFTFEEGKSFEPDFILFLRKKEDEKMQTWQIFIEPKGSHLLRNTDEQAKEQFLKAIAKEYKLNRIFVLENDTYKLIGLPFFNSQDETQRKEFKNAFGKLYF
jgi:type III restriction enzyme